ncbi:N-acetylmuramoyl-L-alanine amidase [Sporosarcina sp. A2]|uniref:N-acetylmuramoyl-L-alanine amidase n=1 Tax=Sporosarcina sp. A2 TaxID=3393449 RepID=UPI003D78E19F
MKKIALLSASSLLLLSLFSFQPREADAAAYFTDIPTHHRAFEEITYLSQSNILSNDYSSKFGPDEAMTRGHAASMIGEAVQLSGTPTNSRFTDVTSTNPASGYIESSVARGIIKGYSDGTFKPDKTLNRGEMAVLISRAFGYNSNTTTAAANELITKGISKGVGKGNFGTSQLMKRGDFAIFLTRAINAQFREGAAPLQSTPMYVNVAGDDSLNFRTGPTTDYMAIKKIFKGYPVEVFYKVGDWVYMKADNAYGFVHSAYLSSSQPSVSNVKDPVDLAPPPVIGGAPGIAGGASISGQTIIIDPGHGGKDGGSSALGLQEKEITLDVSLRTQKYFAKTPLKVSYTRTTDTFPSLPGRVSFAKQQKGNLFVSVHANAGGGTGTETYYYAAGTNPYEKESKALAIYMQKRMLEAWGLKDRGVKNKSLHVTRENSMPAVLLELGFIDTTKDNSYLKSPVYREAMAKAIVLGTLDYYYNYEGRKDVQSLYAEFGTSPSPRYH